MKFLRRCGITLALSALAACAAEAPAETDPALRPFERSAQFTGEPADAETVERPPALRTPLQVTYPAAMTQRNTPGRARVAFVVTVKGQAEQIQAIEATNRHFAEAAEQTIAKLQFQPAESGGKAVACKMEMPVTFRIADDDEVVTGGVDKPARPRTRLNVRYPAELQSTGLVGEVRVEFVVDKYGVPKDVVAKQATNEAFAAAAVEAVSKLRFEPARHRGRPVATRMQIPITFREQ